MKDRQLLLKDIVCALIVILGIFFLASRVIDLVKNHLDWDDVFNWNSLFLLFWMIGVIAAIAFSICRLFRIQFKQNKTERIIAFVYLCLAALTLYPLLLYTAFSTLTFSIYDSQWKIIRITTSVLSMDICVLWVSILSARLLRKYGLPRKK